MKKGTFNRSAILTTAHQIKRTENISFSEAQKKAWAIQRANQLKTLLYNAVVIFQYVKENQTIRTAKGTLNTNLYFYESKGTMQVQNDNVIRYWDIEANGFRCFKKDRFVKVLSIEKIENLSLAA